MRKHRISNEKYLFVMSAIVGFGVVFFSFIWAFGLGIKKVVGLAQGPADRFWSSLFATASATILFVIGACVFFDKALEPGSNARLWQFMMFASFVLAFITMIASAFAAPTVELDTEPSWYDEVEVH